VTAPPAAATAEFVCETTNVQGAATWSIVSCLSLTATVPRRAARSEFASTRKSTVPLPCPLTADVSAIHAAAVVVDHVQSRVVVTVIVPDPPAAGTDDSELVADT
jgi:hypothetical protein